MSTNRIRMVFSVMNRQGIAVCLALLALLVGADITRAGFTVTQDFSGVNGDLGSNTKAFTKSPITVTATSAVPVGASSNHLYYKYTVNNVDETGLGLLGDPHGDHEISAKELGYGIKLDFTTTSVATIQAITFTIGSVQVNEGFQIFAGSSSSGIFLLATYLPSGSDRSTYPANTASVSAAGPLYTFKTTSGTQFFITAIGTGNQSQQDNIPQPNVLLNCVSVDYIVVPAPSSALVAISGLVVFGLFGMGREFRRRQLFQAA